MSTDAIAPTRHPFWRRPAALAELFALSNLAFLAIDVYIAHSMNKFAHWAEWIPFGYSVVSPFFLALATTMCWPDAMAGSRPEDSLAQRAARGLGMMVGLGAVMVGVAGFVWHLESQFFVDRTIHSLVYTAPFVAPLSYAGIGLVILLNRMVPAEANEWGRWVVALALGGFIGNFILSLADHAQNGFFDPREWIAVGSSALAVASLTSVLCLNRHWPAIRQAGLMMVVQVMVGVAGWVFHLQAILSSPMDTLWDRVVYSAPAFAPLLFADLALLAALGLWQLAGRTAELRS